MEEPSITVERSVGVSRLTLGAMPLLSSSVRYWAINSLVSPEALKSDVTIERSSVIKA